MHGLTWDGLTDNVRFKIPQPAAVLLRIPTNVQFLQCPYTRLQSLSFNVIQTVGWVYHQDYCCNCFLCLRFCCECICVWFGWKLANRNGEYTRVLHTNVNDKTPSSNLIAAIENTVPWKRAHTNSLLFVVEKRLQLSKIRTWVRRDHLYYFVEELEVKSLQSPGIKGRLKPPPWDMVFG